MDWPIRAAGGRRVKFFFSSFNFNELVGVRTERSQKKKFLCFCNVNNLKKKYVQFKIYQLR